MKRLVRYRVRADCVEENERLVRQVYEALREARPRGLRYVSFRLPDGVSFMHLVAAHDAAASQALTSLPHLSGR